VAASVKRARRESQHTATASGKYGAFAGPVEGPYTMSWGNMPASRQIASDTAVTRRTSFGQETTRQP
jgi:hypothetical protein